MNQLPMDPAAAGASALAEMFVVPFFAGEILADKYEVIEPIGAGAVGYVISARRIELGDKVAIKFLRPELLSRDEVVGRFTEEARTAVMIQSQHVVRVFEVGMLPAAGPFIAMEFLDGKDLSGVIADQGPLPVAQAVEYVLQACEALATAHACGVIHREVKPENLFLTRSLQGMDVIKVLDLGISKVVTSEPPVDHKVPYVTTTSRMGSPMYMSPEQVRASKDLDLRCDMWGIGCVLYELLTGCPAFDALSLPELVSKILERTPAPMRSCRADVSAELEAIVFRCLQKDADERFANIGELALALSPFTTERARVWAQRCCHVLKSAEALTTAGAPATKIESMETSPTSLQPAVYDLDAPHASDHPTFEIGFSVTRSRELGGGFWQHPRRAAAVIGWTGIAAACVLWSLRHPNVGAAGAALVLVSTAGASDAPPAPSAPASAAAPSASEAIVNPAPSASHASTRESRSSRPASRAPSRSRSAASPSSEASTRDGETTEFAERAPAPKTEGKKRTSASDDDKRADSVE